MSIDLIHAKNEFADFLKRYPDQEEPGFRLKVIHTYHVAENAAVLSEMLDLSEEDRELAELIGLLHDIGRFEELRVTGELNNLSFDHAAYGVKMLFEDGMIRNFIREDGYDEIIRKAILYHSLKEIPSGLKERELLHARLIRDADKLDNFRVKIEEPTENLFPGRINSVRQMEESVISPAILKALLKGKCADIHDRITPLDYYACIFGFAYDLNYACSRQMVLAKRYIEQMEERYVYRDEKTRKEMRMIRESVLCYLKKEELPYADQGNGIDG